jgi:hypothetical protein
MAETPEQQIMQCVIDVKHTVYYVVVLLSRCDNFNCKGVELLAVQHREKDEYTVKTYYYKP